MNSPDAKGASTQKGMFRIERRSIRQLSDTEIDQVSGGILRDIAAAIGSVVGARMGKEKGAAAGAVAGAAVYNAAKAMASHPSSYTYGKIGVR